MDLKEKLFAIFLVIVIVFPFFFQKKEIIVKNKISLPSMTLDNGNFKQYDTNLKKTGTFKHLDFYNNNYYKTNNLTIHFLDKNSTLITKKLIYKKIYNLFNVKYITNQYTYVAKKAIYDDKINKAIAYNFHFYNDKIIGYGKIMIYKNNIITANNIKYIFKGLK